MPTPTDRFALDTFDPGESWDHTDTVQFLDEIAVARDTVANRPTSGTYDGEIFFATDEEIFYQWDATGTQWNEVLNAPTQSEFDSHSTRHESGGADEIPLNNLDLPAGAQIDEDGGDLVVRDSGGSIVLRRDETAGTWDFVSGDLTGITSLEAGKATVGGDRIGTLDTNDDTPVMVGTTDDNRTFGAVLQSSVDSDPGYAGTYGIYDPEGYRVGWYSGDAAHKHLKIYVRPSPLDGTPDTPSPHTEFNMDTDLTSQVVTGADSRSVYLRLRHGGTGNESRLAFQDSEAGIGDAIDLRYGSPFQRFRLYDHINEQVSLVYSSANPSWSFEEVPMTGLREIENPTAGDLSDQEWAWDATNSRWLFKDSSGTAHYFTPDGTL